MLQDLHTTHYLNDFIQERAMGARVRQWLMMGESERVDSMQSFQTTSQPAQVEAMQRTLWQLAAAYPDYAVRSELVWLYGTFMKGKSIPIGSEVD